ncbi:putative RNA-directed DNA polymerase [Tanacetum coccineum]
MVLVPKVITISPLYLVNFLPPIGPHPAEPSMPEEVVQPTQDFVVDGPNSLDVNSPNSIKSNYDLNMTLGLGTDVSDDDKELEDLFCRFECISESVILGSQTNVGRKRKSKQKKRNLVVGGSSTSQALKSQLNQDDCIDEEVAIRNIGEQLGFSFGPSGSVGASGGILAMWDSRVFTMEQTFCDRNFLGITCSWVVMANKVGLINVYAPQSSLLKEALWSSIESLVTSVNVIWVIFCDFNVVRSCDERSGCRFDIDEANVFSDFISRVGFFDFPLGGRRFTRFDQEGRKSSKLDRFMVSPVFFDFWKDAHVKVMCRSFSDHCPILLKVESLNFGPKPFSVFDKWIGNADFNALISDFWNQASDILLKNKLKSLRLAIKSWSCEQVSAQIQPKETLLGRLLDWDVRAKNGLLSDVDIAKREEWLIDLGHIEQLRINVNEAWIKSPDDIKQASLDYFSARFKEEIMTRPSFTSSRFLTLSPNVAQALESEFTMDEVKDAVWNCVGSKSLGPDGFNFNFIKSHWEVLKFDFWNYVKHFELTGRLGNGCNASFVVLIPKKNDPLGFLDCRPISLIGCVCKIISKLLASRLAGVVDSVIRPNQSAFIEGR